jgi:hypothetical protein
LQGRHKVVIASQRRSNLLHGLEAASPKKGSPGHPREVSLEPPRPCEAAKQSPSYPADFACQAGDCFASLAMTAMNGAITAAENAASLRSL